MALYYDLPVFKDVYKLIIKLFEYTKDFPREYKYTLGQDIKRDGIQLVRSIYRANKEKDKRAYLEYFLDDFEILEIGDKNMYRYENTVSEKTSRIEPINGQYWQTNNRMAQCTENLIVVGIVIAKVMTREQGF